MDTRVLITGFEPFDGERLNPSLQAVRLLDGRALVSKDKVIHLYSKAIPTVFGDSAHALAVAIDTIRPDIVVSVGQAGGRCHITPERIAINVDDARISDNCGDQPIDRAIVPDGPVAYWSTLPIKRIVQSLMEAGIPASVSNSAGTYVCNHLFYCLMHILHTQYRGIQGGFIHIPFLPEQVTHRDAPSMALSDIVRALEIAITVTADEQRDAFIPAGKEC